MRIFTRPTWGSFSTVKKTLTFLGESFVQTDDYKLTKLYIPANERVHRMLSNFLSKCFINLWFKKEIWTTLLFEEM